MGLRTKIFPSKIKVKCAAFDCSNKIQAFIMLPRGLKSKALSRQYKRLSPSKITPSIQTKTNAQNNITVDSIFYIICAHMRQRSEKQRFT